MSPTLEAAVWASTPAILAAAAAQAWDVPVNDYAWASTWACGGILWRHLWEGSQKRVLDYRALFFDLPTAPMIGVILYTFWSWLEVDTRYTAGLIVFGAFLGPEWIRVLGTRLIDILIDTFVRRRP